MFCNDRLPLNKTHLSFLSFSFLHTLPARASQGLLLQGRLLASCCNGVEIWGELIALKFCCMFPVVLFSEGRIGIFSREDTPETRPPPFALAVDLGCCWGP